MKMKLGNNGFDLIKKFEGCKLKAYKCSANVWTIGWGSTFYDTKGEFPVKEGDTCTQDEADLLFLKTLQAFVNCVRNRVKLGISQNKFDAMVSLAYNIGCGAFSKSTLLKKVIANPNDPSIGNSFLSWNKANKKVIKGLTNRRTAEATLYFTV